MKYHGYVGYADAVEAYPGVWEEQITEREYFGDIVRNRTNVSASSNINGSISLNNDISIIADPFIRDNFYNIRYITLYGKKWKVKSMELVHPRIIIGIGEMYNE